MKAVDLKLGHVKRRPAPLRSRLCATLSYRAATVRERAWLSTVPVPYFRVTIPVLAAVSPSDEAANSMRPAWPGFERTITSAIPLNAFR